MRFLSIRVCCLPCIIFCCLVGSARADSLETGIAAYRSGQYDKAIAVWTPLAESGNADAQLFLGFMYMKGRGVERNIERSAHWYREAARQGLAEAQYELGLMYEIGQGVDTDPVEADYWYSKAISQDFCPAELQAGGVLGGE